MSDNVNHPKHYENGPFECIELSRLLSSDWGQVVQYCFRWQHKNGVEDLKKALWFINDALKHSVPPIAAWNTPTCGTSCAKPKGASNEHKSGNNLLGDMRLSGLLPGVRILGTNQESRNQ